MVEGETGKRGAEVTKTRTHKEGEKMPVLLALCYAVLGIEPRTSRTRSEDHATRPNSQWHCWFTKTNTRQQPVALLTQKDKHKAWLLVLKTFAKSTKCCTALTHTQNMLCRTYSL